MKLYKGDTVGLISCCDGISNQNKEHIEKIEEILNDMGLKLRYAETIYKTKGPFAGTGKERANELMKLFKDQNIKAIFDVSGGASANQILGYLDYEVIKKNNKAYFGMSGVVIGGNMQALSKVVGTKYMPDFQDKVLLLESLGGAPNLIGSILFQLEHVGAFDKIKGIILGEFTEMKEENHVPDLMELIREVLGDRNIPIVKTDDIGHSPNSKCIVIGEAIHLKK